MLWAGVLIMQVNNTIYPERETALSGITLTSTQLNTLGFDAWEDSIAISQSTAEIAPYNNITYFAWDDTVTPNRFDYENVKNNVQKIMLYYTQTFNNFGSNQYFNSSVAYDGANYFIGQLFDANYYFYSMRKYPVLGAWTTGLINAMQAKYNNNAYHLIRGADFQKILAVVCIAFTDGSYCSLKYYLDNSQTINRTPSFTFMIGLIDNDNSQYNQTFYGGNIADLNVKYWQKNNNVISQHSSMLQLKYPCPVSGALSPLPLTGVRSMGSISSPAVVMPLVGVIGGSSINLNNYWTYQHAASIPIFGGEYLVDYTLSINGTNVQTILSQAGIDKTMKIASTYGLPFSIEFPAGRTDLYNSDINTYIPIANDGGFYNGNYEVLTINGIVSSELTNDNISLWTGGKNAPYNNRTYDPTVPVQTDSIDLIQPTLTAIDAFNRTYVINRSDVDALGQIFWSADDSILTKIKKAWDLFGEKPINGVINLMLFPFDVRTKTGATTIENITFGTYDTNILAYRLPQTAQVVFDLGRFKWNFEFGDTFLDYSPYTEAELYVPFFGVFPLSNEHFIGKTIDIKLVVDYITGSATAIVYVVDRYKRHPVIYKNATIGVQVPVSGDDVQQRITAMLDNSLKVMDTVGKGVDAIAGKSIEKGVDAIGQVISPEFTPATMYQNAGSSTPENSLYLPKKPYIILYTPNPLDVSSYGHSIGFATMESVTIDDCQGFSKFSNIDLTGITATQAEQQQILNLLESGVYL